jgi:hypothetical protein
LEVDAALCENGDGVLGSLWKIDIYLERSSGLAWYIVRNMLRDGVVKVGIPFRVRILCCVGLGLQDISLAREAIEVEILLLEIRRIMLKIILGKLTGPNVLSNPLVILGYTC